MICLHSGYCCIHYDVIIVDDPELGIIDGNLKHKPSGIPCQHLKGEGAGKYVCAIHDKEWYNETPCAAYTQVGRHDAPCRTGERILNKEVRV